MEVCSQACVSAVCEGSTLKCQLGSMSFSRSLGQTLIAAASTLAFIAAANLQFAPIVSSISGTWKRWFKHIALALAEPFYANAYSVLSAFIMWYARRKLPVEKRGWGQEIAIILNCPLFIEIPAEYSEIAATIYREKSRTAPHQSTKVQEPKGEMNLAAVGQILLDVSAETDIGAVAEPTKEQNIPPVGLRIRPAYDEYSSEISVEWMEGVQIESESDIEDWHSAELPAKPAQYLDDDLHLESTAHHTYKAHDHHQHPPQRYYIKVDPSPFNSRAVHERFLLLQLGLVPEYEQLRFLRSRSTFQAVVTTVQALGYIIGVVQRMLQPHGRGVSPLEAILSFFNLLVILQLFLNLFSCVHYQRPLLLRLHRLQFSIYSKEQRCDRYRFLRYPFLDSDTSQNSKRFLFIGAFISLIFLAIIQFAYIRYSLSYLHHLKCLLCSLSTFIFCFLAVSAVILLGILNSKKFRELSAQAKLSFIIRIFSGIVSTASIVLALVATIRSWHLYFNKPNVNLYAWIVPHVSS